VHCSRCSVYSVLAKKLANISFLQGLALMIDILEEFSLLSESTQIDQTFHKSFGKFKDWYWKA
jgi:hypothetical protein